MERDQSSLTQTWNHSMAEARRAWCIRNHSSRQYTHQLLVLDSELGMSKLFQTDHLHFYIIPQSYQILFSSARKKVYEGIVRGGRVLRGTDYKLLRELEG